MASVEAKAAPSLKELQTAALLKAPVADNRIRVRRSPAEHLGDLHGFARDLGYSYSLTSKNEAMQPPALGKELADMMIMLMNAASDMGFSMQNEIEKHLDFERK